MSGLNLTETITFRDHWHYEITGYDWRLVAGNPIGGILRSDGSFGTLLGSLFTGTSVVKASIEGQGLLTNVSLIASTIGDESIGSYTYHTPFIYQKRNVTINILQITNMLGAEMSYLNLRGVAIKDPPVPTGQLEIPGLVYEGATPNLKWTVSREGATGTTTSSNVVVSSALTSYLWNFTLSPGQTTASVSADIDGENETSDAPNVGVNFTLNPEEDSIALEAVITDPTQSSQAWGDNGNIIVQTTATANN